VTRLVIFTTHPIQYQVPWFRALANEPGIELDVVYSYIPAAADQGIGFGTAFSWDIPLFEGYRHRVLEERRLPLSVPRFAQRWARGIGAALDDIKPDAAMILGWQEISLLQAALACRRRAIPIVLRGESNAKRQRPPHVQKLHQVFFAQFDAFLAIGKSNAELYSLGGVRPERIFTAGYCVDNTRFAAGAEALRSERVNLRRKWGLSETGTVLVFVGKLESKKQVMHFLLALAEARRGGAEVEGLIVGTGEEASKAKAFVSEHALPVTFAGFLNQSEIVAAYVAADALVLPSDYGETWGLVVNEAMASGLPVIVSERVGAAHDLVCDGVTGWVVPFADINALASAMAVMSGDLHQRARMGLSAVQRVTDRYSIAYAVTQTQAVLKYLRPHAV
jgi:glycosyltransferase involved in cell wall biosynthesis